MKKYTFPEIKAMFLALNDQKIEKPVKAVAVIAQSSFKQPYTELERSYAFNSDNKAFKSWCGGYSIFASCLDGTDPCVRLEQYIGGGGWDVEYCYLVDA